MTKTRSKTCSGKPRDTQAKLRLFRERFQGLEHVYGTYDPATGRSWQVKRPVTERVLLDHLCGRRPFGVYLLREEHCTAIVADFDDNTLENVIALVERGRDRDLPLHIERSKSKGFHVWLFSNIPMRASIGRHAMRQLLEEAGHPSVEVFPKQDRIDPDRGGYGNFINAPLYGGLVPQRKTVFLDPGSAYEPFPNQWDFLESATVGDPEQLNEWMPSPAPQAATRQPVRTGLGVYEGAGSLPPCARTMLALGVTENQRVACFRLAVNLRRVGLDFDASVAVLLDWAKRNRPTDGKRVITTTEIMAQTAAAYLREYSGFGCEDPAVSPYCEPHCPVHRHRGGSTETPRGVPPLEG